MSNKLDDFIADNWPNICREYWEMVIDDSDIVRVISENQALTDEFIRVLEADKRMESKIADWGREHYAE